MRFIFSLSFCLILFLDTARFGISHSAEKDQVENSAIILMYHRFGEGDYPSTNITLEQFEAQLKELQDPKYTILPLSEITSALKAGEALPARTIGLSIDDGFLSIYHQAWPRLKKAGFPFTLFISTKAIEEKFKGYMSWDQIREMQKDPLVSIGHHGHSHGHLLNMSTEAVRADLETASRLYQQELGLNPDIFAYPYGEFSPETENILKKMGLKAAFGQYSSAASSARNIMALPRFAFNEKYSTMGRFKLIISARALPIVDLLPISPVLKDNNPPTIGFTVMNKVRGLSALGCFPSHMREAAEVKRVDGNRVEVRFNQPFPQGRSRINCTMPGPDKRWYWFGMAFFN